eukprot:8741030-Pyramimonas_sp.AAC.1
MAEEEDRLGLLDGVGVDGVGGSPRIADASAMRLDVGPVATSATHLRYVADVADASPMHQ